MKNSIHSFRATFAVLCLLSVVPATAMADTPSEPQSLINFLNQTIVWYRQLSAQQQLANQPSDVLFLSDNRQLADQIVARSFEFARTRAQALAAAGTTSVPSADGTQDSALNSRLKTLMQLTAKVNQQIQQAQADLDSQKKELATAVGKKRKTLESSIAETESELDLMQARRDTLQNIMQFAGGTSGGSLLSQVEELARTVPVTSKTSSGENTAPTRQAANQTNLQITPKSEPSGIIGLISEILATRRKVHSLDDAIQSTNGLEDASKAMRAPLSAEMKELVQRGDALANQPDLQDPDALAQQKKEVDALTARFKQLSASILPLGKQSILIDLYQRSLGSWRASVVAEYHSELKSLVWRLGLLAVLLGIVFFFSELWRRATFRYVQDPRRRYQFMLLRRILLWFLIAVIITVTFASELGSLATFAGLLTAGVAVALQNVILSVAGYFFLIGKYGIRVGDRVQIAGVTGDVVDIGLVRLHLMEVGDGGFSARPTGRIVVFSNAVVFQANAGLFKQVPGTKFVWHEITLTLPPDSDYHGVENRVMRAVKSVFAGYKDRMSTEHRKMEQLLTGVPVHNLDPESRLRLTPKGVDVVIRYPVELDQAAEIDDRIARQVLDATEQEPKVQVTGTKSAEEIKNQPAVPPKS
ncbi:MAG TPA: mechanosensitive ion channel domain-containing protein [Terriglobales bacterium]|nr:mechanosensitive ion channel domain-containing protein [Terriglobales bacterium]